MKRTLAFVALVTINAFVYAHHSTLGFYDHDNKVVAEGIITELSLRNPHVHIGLQQVDEAGYTIDWDLETSALSVLRTRGIDLSILNVGDRITAAGSGSRRGRPEMYLSNILLADGTEVLINIQATPYFTETDSENLYQAEFSEETIASAKDNADGIFRVWSTVMGDPASFPMFKGDYPLNQTAAARRDAWDPVAEEMLACWEKGMPLLMITPVPVEFQRAGENILIRFTEDDAERLIYMNPENQSPPETHSLLGYSTGRWEGETLVVETSQVNAQAFDDRGTSQSENITLVERFDINDTGDRMEYRISISDNDTFTEPFELTRYWTWRPEVTVQDWKCGENQG